MDGIHVQSDAKRIHDGPKYAAAGAYKTDPHRDFSGPRAVLGGIHALPQFVEAMKQWMDQAIAFRKMTNDFMAKVRNEMQAASRDDIDNVMLSVRHMEKRCSIGWTS